MPDDEFSDRLKHLEKAVEQVLGDVIAVHGAVLTVLAVLAESNPGIGAQIKETLDTLTLEIEGRDLEVSTGSRGMHRRAGQQLTAMIDRLNEITRRTRGETTS